MIAAQIAQRFGGGSVFTQSYQKLCLWSAILNVFAAFSAYESQPASKRMIWRTDHPEAAELIDQVKDFIGDEHD